MENSEPEIASFKERFKGFISRQPGKPSPHQLDFSRAEYEAVLGSFVDSILAPSENGLF